MKKGALTHSFVNPRNFPINIYFFKATIETLEEDVKYFQSQR